MHIYELAFGGVMMETAKIFANGGSQAVRLPKDCRFDDDEVLINHIGSVVILMPKNDPWTSMMSALQMFTDDCFKQTIEDLPVQERSGL